MGFEALPLYSEKLGILKTELEEIGKVVLLGDGVLPLLPEPPPFGDGVLPLLPEPPPFGDGVLPVLPEPPPFGDGVLPLLPEPPQIGRASCRERV